MTVCWQWWRTDPAQWLPHRCQQPPEHPGPHICNCNQTIDRETETMTDHPAKPAGYKPFRDPAQIEADARADERAKWADEIAAVAATYRTSEDADYKAGLRLAASMLRRRDA